MDDSISDEEFMSMEGVILAHYFNLGITIRTTEVAVDTAFVLCVAGKCHLDGDVLIGARALMMFTPEEMRVLGQQMVDTYEGWVKGVIGPDTPAITVML